MGNKFVAFIDILGFKEKILNTNFNDDVDVRAVEKIVCDFISNFEKNFPNYWAFSDCIVLSDDIAEDADEVNLDSYSAKEKILGLGHSICWSIQEGKYVIRGALTYGSFKGSSLAISRGQGKSEPEHNPTADFIFGSALVNAYILESKYAIYPNILVANEIVNALDADIKEDLLYCYDEKFYINYLWIHFKDNIEIEHELYREHFELINQKIHDIENHLSMTDAEKEKAMAKFTWLKTYHNSFIDRMIDQEVAESAEVEEITNEEYREELMIGQPYFY